MTGPSQYREVDTTRLNGTLVCTATFALATPAGRAAASTAVTVRPAPLDCGAAVYSVPAVNATGATRTGSAVCGSYKDARNGKAPKFVTNVTIGVTDPQGFAAVVAITNVTTNVNPALHPSCGRCKAGRRETCGCVQIAEALGAGRARLMPQPQFKINRTYVDLSYKIYYTATVAETGSSCTGSVVSDDELCVCWGGGCACSEVASHWPPHCLPAPPHRLTHSLSLSSRQRQPPWLSHVQPCRCSATRATPQSRRAAPLAVRRQSFRRWYAAARGPDGGDHGAWRMAPAYIAAPIWI